MITIDNDRHIDAMTLDSGHLSTGIPEQRDTGENRWRAWVTLEQIIKQNNGISPSELYTPCG